jgi:hypothetical protein
MRDTRTRMHAIADVHRGSDIRAVSTAASIRAVCTAAIQSFTDHGRSPWQYRMRYTLCSRLSTRF